jgi:hypothetical protein
MDLAQARRLCLDNAGRIATMSKLRGNGVRSTQHRYIRLGLRQKDNQLHLLCW